MYKKIIEKAFDEENEKYIEYLESDEFKKSFEECKEKALLSMRQIFLLGL